MKIPQVALLFLAAAVVVSPPSRATAADPATWTLNQRGRVETEPGSGQFKIVERQSDWNPQRTAVVVCDMWDRHWCQGATDRVAEMAPRMNDALHAARKLGMLVIHCPSDCMKFYEGTAGRKLAQDAPKSDIKPLPAGWCPLAEGREPPLPFDNSKDRCDCDPQCPHGNPWRRQIATLEIIDGDAITDNDEAINLLRSRGIENIVVMGVHTNMCVLGRPFSIRRLCAQGFNVVLARDLTDSMHDSLSPPLGLDHFRATELVVEHIEKYWCPTITSRDLLGGAAFSFRGDRRPHVVLLIGEDEYETDRTLPAFAEVELAPRGVRTTILHANPQDKNDFPGLAALDTADALLVSVRRRTPAAEQLAMIRRYVAAGKPVVGIRTASHAFSLRNNQPPPEGHAAWPEFDDEILGGHYTGHHDSKPSETVRNLVWVLPEAKGNPLVAGLPEGEFQTDAWLYKTRPLAATASPVMFGRVEGRQPDEPAAWTNKPASGNRVFYTSLGHPTDFELPAFRRLLVNGIFWAICKPAPEPAEK